jgi:hypothetical protein
MLVFQWQSLKKETHRMKKWFCSFMNDIIINIHQRCCEPPPVGQPNKPRLLLFTTGRDEPIERPPMIVNLTPLKPGFRRPFTLTADEPVDLLSDGINYFKATTVLGDSTVTFTNQTSTSAQGFVNGDGSLGNKQVQISADAHVGEGEVSITIDVTFTVEHADATSLGFVLGSPDEPIPTAPPTP